MFVVNDLLDQLLLGCFFFGLVFSALSLVLGIADVGLGHGAGHDGHLPHLGHHGHDLGHGHGHSQDNGLSPISLGTILGFLTWFGGVAYLLRNGMETYVGISVVVGVAAGLSGAYLIYWLLTKVHAQEAGLLTASDDYMPGTIGRVTSSIRAGGTGEIVYERRGVRKVMAARCSKGVAIPRGTEVVVVQHRAGIADVEPWSTYVGDEFADLDLAEAAANSASSDHPAQPIDERALPSRPTGG